MSRTIYTTIIFICLQLVGTSSYSQVKTLSLKQQEFTPSEPSDLKRFALIEMKKSLLLSGNKPEYSQLMTDVRVIIETDSVQTIENYAIVQFIRGCQFSSYLENGHTYKTLDISRHHFAKVTSFQHRQWEIDNDEVDPIYTSDALYGRFALLRWNHNPESFDAENTIFYGVKKPPHSVVFTTDLPGSAHLSPFGGNLHARNSSLEFQTCLFKTSDLPLTTTPEGRGVDLDQAIACFQWDHKFVYNYNSKSFISGGPIDPICDVN